MYLWRIASARFGEKLQNQIDYLACRPPPLPAKLIHSQCRRIFEYFSIQVWENWKLNRLSGLLHSFPSFQTYSYSRWMYLWIIFKSSWRNSKIKLIIWLPSFRFWQNILLLLIYIFIFSIWDALCQHRMKIILQRFWVTFFTKGAKLSVLRVPWVRTNCLLLHFFWRPIEQLNLLKYNVSGWGYDETGS